MAVSKSKSSGMQDHSNSHDHAESSRKDHESTPGFPTQPHRMQHAFIVVGSDTIFLCHQIMSHMEGHNCEMVLEVSLPAEIQKLIIEDRSKNGSTHYLANMEDELLRLEDIKSGDVGSFNAHIWNSFPKYPNLSPPWGTPDNPIKPWIPKVKVEVRRVIHYDHVNENIVSRKHEEYVLFGREKEAHIYHTVVCQPEYDHIATLKSVPYWLNEVQLLAGIKVSIVSLPWSKDKTYCGNPLPDNTSHPVLYYGIAEYRKWDGSNPIPMPVPGYYIDVEKTWWYSTRVVNYFNRNPCSPDLEIS